MTSWLKKGFTLNRQSSDKESDSPSKKSSFSSLASYIIKDPNANLSEDEKALREMAEKMGINKDLMSVIEADLHAGENPNGPPTAVITNAVRKKSIFGSLKKWSGGKGSEISTNFVPIRPLAQRLYEPVIPTTDLLKSALKLRTLSRAMIIVNMALITSEEGHFAVITRGSEIVEKLPIDCTSAAMETDVGAFSFQISSYGKILNLNAPSDLAVTAWVDHLRQFIAGCDNYPSDPIFKEALLRQTGTSYDVKFLKKRTLGLVFEKMLNWAIVAVGSEDLGIQAGSVLTAVNDISVTTEPFNETLAMLKGWNPPLKLTFRRSPEKSGFLMKYVPAFDLWKQQYFVLSEGVLKMYDSDVISPDDEPVMSTRLKGLVVSLTPFSEIKRENCFTFQSGFFTSQCQAPSHHEMLEWACALYYGLAIANGGGYILTLEELSTKLGKSRKVVVAEAIARMSQLEILAQLQQLKSEEMTQEELDTIEKEFIEGVLEDEGRVGLESQDENQDLYKTVKEIMDDCISVVESRFRESMMLFDPVIEKVDESLPEFSVAEDDENVPDDGVIPSEDVIGVSPLVLTDDIAMSGDAADAADGLSPDEEAELPVDEALEPPEEIYRAALLLDEDAPLEVPNVDSADYVPGDVEMSPQEDDAAIAPEEIYRAALLLDEDAPLEVAQYGEIDSSYEELEAIEDNTLAGSEIISSVEDTVNSSAIPAYKRSPTRPSRNDLKRTSHGEALLGALGATLPAPPSQKKVEMETSGSQRTTVPVVDTSTVSFKSTAPKIVKLGEESITVFKQVFGEELKGIHLKEDGNYDPVDEDDLRRAFLLYAKAKTGSTDYINVMQFSTIWRKSTGVKGNLYKEMKVFNSCFDLEGKGYVKEEDFIRGWLAIGDGPFGALILHNLMQVVAAL